MLRSRLAAIEVNQSLTAEIFKQTMHEVTTEFVTQCNVHRTWMIDIARFGFADNLTE